MDASNASVEIKASVQAAAVFVALDRGDLSAAARAQQSLREMGWLLTREHAPRQRPRKAVAPR